MNLARYSINTQIFTWIIILIALLGGTWGFLSVGRLEDPAFTIKQAVVVTITGRQRRTGWREVSGASRRPRSSRWRSSTTSRPSRPASR
ncbi:MAG: hypothetical protein R3D59_12490 [Paracoccaceae bacterium]